MHDDLAGAADTIYDENILGGSCARACPTEVLCEGACVDRTLLKSPVAIGRLQRFATDGSAPRNEPGPATGKRVAIVGSGPAGLSCAYTLRRYGHAVDIYEAQKVPGGLNTFGISAYKISTSFSLSEVKYVTDMGVTIHTDHPIDATALEALQQEYDAVFVGVGLGGTQILGIQNEDSNGVVEALSFIRESHDGPFSECRVGQNVIVIGGGNTAIDVATQAVRLGAEKVTIAYRRTRTDMSAFAYEYEIALADGVKFEWLSRPVEILASSDHVTGVVMERLESIGTGRTSTLETVPDSRFTLKCDMLIKALGQNPNHDLLGDFSVDLVRVGRIQVDSGSGATGVPGIFAGGDCLSRGAEIVDAVQDGKVAAGGIHRFLNSTLTS